jgi:hypothetical protein
MANNYATNVEAFSDMSEGNYTSVEAPEIERFIAAASRLIDGEFGRWAGFFYPTTDDVTRYYDGSGCDEQDIDEFASITSVSVAESGGTSSSDYTLWSSTDYQVEPYNYIADGKPIKRLVIDINGSKPGWYGYRKSVKVVGIAGYSVTPPSLISSACRLQAVRWFMRAKGGWQDTIGNDEIGRKEYKGMVELDPDIRAMLWALKLELM